MQEDNGVYFEILRIGNFENTEKYKKYKKYKNFVSGQTMVQI